MKRQHIFLTIIFLLIIWLLTGGYYTDSENKPIKQITKTTGVYLFGKRKIWTISTMKEVEYYNSKRQLTRHDYYNGENSVDSRYEYSYYPFDSVYQIIWLTGNNLTPHNITEYKYDSLNRLIKETESSINKMTNEKSSYDVDEYFYDSLGRNSKIIMKHFSTPDTSTSTFLEEYDSKNRIIRSTHFTENQFKSSKYVTAYNYDTEGFIKSKFGGLLDDSIYYKTNANGKIIEEYKKYERYPNFITGHNKYQYDNNKNKIQTILDIDEGLTYDFNYDKNNRLIIEYRPWSLFGLFRGGVKYDYEYYNK